MADFTQPVYKIVCVKVPEGICLCETADLHIGRNFMQQPPRDLETSAQDRPGWRASIRSACRDKISDARARCCMKFRPLCKSAVSHKKNALQHFDTDNLIHWLCKTGHRFKMLLLPCVKATFDVRCSKSTSNSPSCIQICHEKRLIQLLVAFSSYLLRFYFRNRNNIVTPDPASIKISIKT